MKNFEKVQDLHLNYVNTGKLLEGFEKYYAEEVVMQELGEAPRIGKAANREREIQFLSQIKEVHGGGILSIAADEANNKTMVESWMDLTFTNNVRVEMKQVAVQTWSEGQIVNELFYHK